MTTDAFKEHNRGWEGMSPETYAVTKGMVKMKDTYETSIMPMFHIGGIKKDYGKTPVGGAVVIAVTDREAWMATALMCQAEFGGAEWAALFSDAWVRAYEGDEDRPEKMPPGTLEKLRNSGDMKVQEAMTTVLVRDSGVSEHVQVRYWCNSDGNIEWAEPEWFISGEDGVQGVGYMHDVLSTLVGIRKPAFHELVEVLQNLGRLCAEELVFDES